MNPEQNYKIKLAEAQSKFQFYQNRLRWTGMARLLAFLLVVVSPFVFLPDHVGITLFLIGAGIIAFLWLLAIYTKLEYWRDFYRSLVEINLKELRVLKFEFTEADEGGDEFVNDQHPFAFDLDLFGKDSLFQHINRTSTQSGKKALAQWLTNRSADKEGITNKQSAIEELSKSLDWRLAFMANGRIFKEKSGDDSVFQKWKTINPGFKNEWLVGFFILFMPTITVALILLNVFGIIPFSIILIAVFTQWSIQFFYVKKTNYYYRFFGKQNALLRKYESLFKLIENHTFKSEILQTLKEDESSPSYQIRKLRKLMEAYDNRINMFAGVLLISIFMWELLSAYRLVMWHRRCKPYFEKWHQIIEKYDVLVSLAGYAYNHPDFNYPVISKDSFSFSVKGLGHPLIPEERCIVNNYEQLERESVTIITGANMAGKSTFLRSVGLAIAMANAGLPTFTQSFAYSPLKLFTSMRTTDSVTSDESYFFAESKRLRLILDEVEKGQPLFILLDEVLKGTNSVDKLKGSIALVERLVELKTHTIVATHDLKLTEVEARYPEKVKNLCFEIEIDDDKMNFDYTLRSGVTQTMNATFILKQLGIIKDR